MLDRRFHEVANQYSLFTLVIRPPTNYHWIEGREKFHEKIRDNIRRKYKCLLFYRFYDEFDERQQVHSHYIFLTDAPLDKYEFKEIIRRLLAKVWRYVEKTPPTFLMPGDEDFFWDTPAWLVVEGDEFDWSVYCDTPHNLTGLARYLPKDLKDRSKVHPIPDGWPCRTRGGRGFFGKPMAVYWQDTYRAWYPASASPEGPSYHVEAEQGRAAPTSTPTTISTLPTQPRKGEGCSAQFLVKYILMRRRGRRRTARGPPLPSLTTT
jgi:hypothetical protein